MSVKSVHMANFPGVYTFMQHKDLLNSPYAAFFLFFSRTPSSKKVKTHRPQPHDSVLGACIWEQLILILKKGVLSRFQARKLDLYKGAVVEYKYNFLFDAPYLFRLHPQSSAMLIQGIPNIFAGSAHSNSITFHS